MGRIVKKAWAFKMITKMKQMLLLLAFCSAIPAGCKKEYACECATSKGAHSVGTITDTKEKAETEITGLSTNDTSCRIR